MKNLPELQKLRDKATESEAAAEPCNRVAMVQASHFIDAVAMLEEAGIAAKKHGVASDLCPLPDTILGILGGKSQSGRKTTS